MFSYGGGTPVGAYEDTRNLGVKACSGWAGEEWGMAGSCTNRQSRIKSLFSWFLVCTDARLNPATRGTNAGTSQGQFSSALRAGAELLSGTAVTDPDLRACGWAWKVLMFWFVTFKPRDE